MYKQLINKIKEGLENFGKFYSVYEAKVTDNDDPDKLMRIKVICPELFGGNESEWIASSSIPVGKNWGLFFIPQIGDQVLIKCKKGNPRFCIYEYSEKLKNYNLDYDPKNFHIITPSGNNILFNESSNTLELNGKEYSSVLGEELQAQVNKNRAILTGFINALSTPIPEPGNNSPSAFQAALNTAIGSLDVGDFSNILSDKVKLE